MADEVEQGQLYLGPASPREQDAYRLDRPLRRVTSSDISISGGTYARATQSCSRKHHSLTYLAFTYLQAAKKAALKGTSGTKVSKVRTSATFYR